jgi:hypothetical protein
MNRTVGPRTLAVLQPFAPLPGVNHRQVYKFSYHRAKFAFLREATLDDRR